METFIQTVAATVIHRINFPKRLTGRMTRGQCERARVRPLLSEHDEQDARQTVALALLTVGVSEETAQRVRGVEAIAALCPLFEVRKQNQTAARTLGITRWKAAFRATRRALRIDRRVREDAYSFADTPELDVAAEHATVTETRRADLARKVSYAHALIHAAYAADTSRKRRSTFHTHLRTLRAFAAIWGGKFAKHPLCEGASEDALSVTLYRFRMYLAKGEDALTAAAMEGATHRRATYLCNERGELKTFAAL
jgi:hypothetical protein